MPIVEETKKIYITNDMACGRIRLSLYTLQECDSGLDQDRDTKIP